MPNVLRLAIVDPNDKSREALKGMLMGLDTVWLEAECSRYAFYQDVLEQTNADVGFIALDDDPEQAVSLIEKISKSHPKTTLLVSSTSSDGGLILKSMRAGAKEFLTEPLRMEDLAAALQRVARARFGEDDLGSNSTKVIAVSGSTGGVGSTSLAVNLGCELAKDDKNSVVLLDLDLSLGDADVYLDTIPEYTLTDVSQNISRLDFTLLKRSLTKHSSGLYLLPRPVQLEDSALITQDDLSRVIGLLRATFTHLIIDTSKSFNQLDLLAMGIANEVLMVSQLDLPCLRNVVRLLMSFEQNEKLKDKMKIIINRVGQGGSQISLKKAQATIGQDIYWQLPNDFKTMIEVRNNGVPLLEQAPKAPLTLAISELAADITGSKPKVDSSDNTGKSKSWLGLWPGRSGDQKSKDDAESLRNES